MEDKIIRAFLLEEKPIFKRGDKQIRKVDSEDKNIIIRNIFSRKLENITFNDLNMLGYTNPNVFVREWVEENSTFDKNKIIWVVVYVEDLKNE